ncbi:hypothetical protein, partial [Flavobacterium hydatis]|uniref:hypothetical protein n=1 Tax=Flavobacterium hydatis TaxID=991 RepID=UPI003399C929
FEEKYAKRFYRKERKALHKGSQSLINRLSEPLWLLIFALFAVKMDTVVLFLNIDFTRNLLWDRFKSWGLNRKILTQRAQSIIQRFAKFNQ